MIVNYLQSTQFEYILEKYLNKKWDWFEISRETIIEFIENT